MDNARQYSCDSGGLRILIPKNLSARPVIVVGTIPSLVAPTGEGIRAGDHPPRVFRWDGSDYSHVCNIPDLPIDSPISWGTPSPGWGAVGAHPSHAAPKGKPHLRQRTRSEFHDVELGVQHIRRAMHSIGLSAEPHQSQSIP